MKESKKKYWKGLEEINPTEEFVKNSESEFAPSVFSEDGGTSRRDFLKILGFGVAAASLAACEAPVKKAIPYLNKPEDIDPGVANYYASTYSNAGDYCSILVKTREGRPIKVEGNTLSSLSQGGTNARVQASVLSLYDENRLRAPKASGKDADWSSVDGEIKSKLAGTSGQIVIVSNTILSPSTKTVIKKFQAKYPSAKHVTYDAVSNHAMLEANRRMFGKFAVPSYDFSQAKTIVSFGADFLGTWISDIEYSKQYAKNRKVGNKNSDMSRHYQFESIMSMTGANSDIRTSLKPSELPKAVVALYNEIAKANGAETVSVSGDFANIKKAAADLLSNKGKSLVVVDSNNVSVNLLVNKINELLGNYGTTVNMDKPSFQRQGNNDAMNQFVADVKAGSVGAVIFLGSNPVLNFSKGKQLADSLKSVALKVSTSTILDETAALCDFVCPDSHYLESWNDAEPKLGMFSLAQPTISPLFNTRQSAESLMIWSDSGNSYLAQIQENWNTNIYPLQSSFGSFQSFWDKSLHDGIFETTVSYESANLTKDAAVITTTTTDSTGVSASVTLGVSISAIAEEISSIKANSEIEFVAYQMVTIGDGSQLNNPWLHECPDPVTKTCWGNYASISRKTALAKGLKQDDVITIFEGNKEFKLPVLIQPGQADNTIGVAVGFGGKGGKTMNFLAPQSQNVFTLENTKVAIAKTGETLKIAQTQTHHTFMGRESVIQEATLSEYKSNPSAGRFFPTVTSVEGEKKAPKYFDLYDKHDYNNHHWGLMIDLNSCTGCSACVVACVSENNIPVVGREEVINRRDMHWMRIDRYYSRNEEFYAKGMFDDGGKSFGMDDSDEIMKSVADNPDVVFQPMMCQHCNHAPCENVCPVAATTHSTEGLNMMAYNRCIGTRYCANNCPFKVRRFNWFNYAKGDYSGSGTLDTKREFIDLNPVRNDLGRMVLNPDIVVRFRGVMEKCTMCVQRIQAGKLEAKKAKRPLQDGDIKTACQQSCPTDAIIFGDMNNPESQISQLKNGEQLERTYTVLEEINVQPNVHYLTKIRNKA